ncbi:MAG: hypothetical protein KUA35_11385 [Pseudodesulfovibrio sp.]|uniref:Uncharacterized protein n=1 Tax=Pseudodesulfovibrio aespoeensis (strain ATCC 700646 / DSM 10631 / Aspo-2) TaxID=643562 RepID=E6VTT9_PSEA9|nr:MULTISPECIES: hypothetical protein [Pseudodesulfovibrio]MBU4192367.1 hypothetical protein [Pseudomonadota bacterium]ADU61031.1 hypothetical protein Daes_0002 [Pseudodesulfovibrio aespoeensis Aspo-2]MBU4243386.1 hypothetical protein [Pseudomonadota bacterium]MBU4378121.1 hypothetical protein [Pseudomonadota bacterium]MBU4475188.1 hypothetical protein [Pseudomonadota bacterium]
MSDHINELFDKDGNLIGALLSAQAWTQVRHSVLVALGIPDQAKPVERPEPLTDWETLKQYWDFAYPVDTDVHCELCGNTTDDWQADDPRKFRLTAANLAGLVSFQCAGCRAKVVKKHFKDRIKTECTPFTEAKDRSKEGHY